MTIANSRPDLLAVFHPAIAVGPSKIHGLGVVAQGRIDANEILVRFGGMLLPSQFRRESTVARSTAIGVSDSVVLAERVGIPRDTSDYINHSCEPNSGLLDALTLVATGPLNVGDEVTIDYAYWEADEDWLLKGPCSCGSIICRRTISGRDWRSQPVAARCLTWASPFIRRRIQSLGP